MRLNPSGSAFVPLLLAAHPGLDSFPTSLTEESAPSVVIEVPMLPTVLFSSPMITQVAVFQGYYSKGPASQTVH